MTAQPQNERTAAIRLGRIAVWLACALLAALLVHHQWLLLDYMHWEDESETVVAAKLMANGERLYADFFNHHGPLTFLPGWLLEQVGDFGIAGHRVPVALAQWLAILALATSAVVRKRGVALGYAGFAAMAMVLYLPEKFGHMYMYQVWAGLGLLIALAQYVLPAIYSEPAVRWRHVVLGNLLLTSLPFLAVTYAPVAAVLILAALRRPYWRLALLTVGAGVLLNLGFLLQVGSLPGYLAYHFYLNAEVLPAFNGGQGPEQLLYAIVKSATDSLESVLLLGIVALALASLSKREPGLPWRTLLLGAGLAMLLMRGGDLQFHRLAYLYAVPALVLVLFRRFELRGRHAWLPLAVVAGLAALKLSAVLPDDRARFERLRTPERTEFSELARQVTDRQEPIIAYAFHNLDYLLAARRPASGNYFYFPWQHVYNQSPVLGVRISACEQIAQARPKVMLIDKADVYDRYPWNSYGGCVQALMDRDYTRIANHPFYLRNDIDPEALGLGREADGYRTEPGPRLRAGQPLPLQLQVDATQPLAALEIRLADSDRTPDGTIRLRLRATDGSTLTVDHSLAAGRRGESQRIEIEPGVYRTATLEALDGDSEIRLLRSRSDDGTARPCLIQEYDSGRRRFTPGCPLL